MLVRRSRFSFHANGTDIFLDTEHSVNFSQSISNNSLRWYENEKSLTFFVTFELLFRQTIEEKKRKKGRKDRAYVDTRRSFEKGKKIVNYFFLSFFFYRGNYYDIIRGTVRRYGYYGSYCELWCYYVEQRHPRAVHTNAGTESEVKGLKRGCVCCLPFLPSSSPSSILLEPHYNSNR